MLKMFLNLHQDYSNMRKRYIRWAPDISTTGTWFHFSHQ